ncbi:MAG: Ig-like domain-containing protein [Candidatus Limnocylindria bacterium]
MAVPLRRHRAITHLVIAATALAVAVGLAIPNAQLIQAGLRDVPRDGPILPANIGVGVASTHEVVIEFPGAMDRDAVQAGLRLAPATDVTLVWSADSTALTLVPNAGWAADERYLVSVPAGTALADGGALADAWWASFTTQTAPWVVSLGVAGVTGTPRGDTPIAVQEVMASTGYPEMALSAATDDVAADTSADSTIRLTFSAAMDHARTQAAFRISPTVAGTFRWQGTTLLFVPDQRLTPGVRYAISVAGARDADGTRLGGDTSFSFTTRSGAQAMTVTPAIGAQGISGQTVTISFSQPMDRVATGAAFLLADTVTGERVTGQITWSADSRTLTFTAASALAAGRTYAARLAGGARDADRNPVGISWQFTTAGGAAPRTFTPAPAAAASSDMVVYALNQLNAARASYGLAPLTLDSAISAVAYAHAAEMLAYGYFSHNSLDGTTYKQRLTNGGISYGYSGENQCYLGYGGGVQATLDWCHAQFWAEPYPGGGNHKDNILSTHFRRVGIGIAVGSNKVIIVWDFTD